MAAAQSMAMILAPEEVREKLKESSFKPHLTLHAMPPEILFVILGDLDRVSSTLAGLTCHKLYSIHFRLNGKVRLSEEGPIWHAMGAKDTSVLANRLTHWMGFKYVLYSWNHNCKFLRYGQLPLHKAIWGLEQDIKTYRTGLDADLKYLCDKLKTDDRSFRRSHGFMFGAISLGTLRESVEMKICTLTGLHESLEGFLREQAIEKHRFLVEWKQPRYSILEH